MTNKKQELRLKNFNELNEETLLNIIKENYNVPSTVKILEFKNGKIEENEILYAYFIGAEVKEYEALKSVGLEDNYTQLKIKLGNYQGENLENLKGRTLNLDSAKIEFNKVRNRINGLSFRIDIDNIKTALQQ